MEKSTTTETDIETLNKSFITVFVFLRYAHLFSQLTYEQMLNLNEEQLENQGVTKGIFHDYGRLITL